ncbi:MAG: adenosylcobalamin-dependent ribonucleoside-diphosphate reductase [bacterium]|nr:adenosylcobalamin-dependent ribonucleoside-diphosphate reductase [bacterium]
MSESDTTTPTDDTTTYAVDDRNHLYPLGYKIFLDRYAVKDPEKLHLDIGDVVLVNTNLETGQKEVGTVKLVDPQTKQVTVQLMEGGSVTRTFEQVDRPLETKPSQMLDRVAKGAASAEKTPAKQQEWEEKFRWALDEWKFVPAGRILAAAGTDQQLTYYNCYVIPSPHDSRGGIFATLSRMAEIFSRGGGVGINVSTLRPRYAYVKGVNGRSSGSVSWASLYSFVTGLIEQGGSRRGALMLILNDWHPDIYEFIGSKQKAGQIENANISVGLSDEFMAAVDKDEEWNLEFPDTKYERYNEEWNGILEQWKEKGYPTVVHQTVRAREMWDKIVTSAWASAEPGIWFRGRSNQASNSWYYSQLICTNPCGEQPLPEWAVCNLGAVNLARFVDDEANVVKWDELKTVIHYATRFLDNVIDATPYFFEENKQQQTDERRVGLNTMGLAEMMIKLGVRYGSPESLTFIDELYSFIVREVYDESTSLAKEKGSFPKFEAAKFLQSGFMQSLAPEIRAMVQERGLRNVTLLTQAPNGTIGTMVNTSTGIEPFYSWTYFRKSRLGLHEEEVSLVQDWRAANPDAPDLPDYFVNAMELAPEDHIKVQAQIQRWVDSAISKTCNVPQDYTVEQVKELYVLMHNLNCKGGTIYRDKSRDEQILMNSDDERAKKEMSANEAAVTTESMVLTDPTEIVRERSSRTTGVTVSKDTPMGKAYITMNNDEAGEPIEVFTRVGKAGSDVNAMTDAMGRLISLVLRLKSAVAPKARVTEIVKQMRGIGGADSRGFGKNRILSVPDAVAIAMLEEYLATPATGVEPSETPEAASVGHTVLTEQAPDQSSLFGGESGKPVVADLCPACGNATFIRQEGCQSCLTCGNSKC